MYEEDIFYTESTAQHLVSTIYQALSSMQIPKRYLT
jgi:hypothetical protein